jgi:hypothetical protein
MKGARNKFYGKIPNVACVAAYSVRSKEKTLVPQQGGFMKTFALNNVRGSAFGHFRKSCVKYPREELWIKL